MTSAENPDTLRSEEAQRLMDETKRAIVNTRKFFDQLAEHEFAQLDQMKRFAPEFEEHKKAIPEQEK